MIIAVSKKMQTLNQAAYNKSELQYFLTLENQLRLNLNKTCKNTLWSIAQTRSKSQA